MSMQSYGNSSGDSVGTSVLTGALVIGAALLLFVSLAGMTTVSSLPGAQAAKPVVEHVVTTAHPHHVM
jgi:hypothetical protein